MNNRDWLDIEIWIVHTMDYYDEPYDNELVCILRELE